MPNCGHVLSPTEYTHYKGVIWCRWLTEFSGFKPLRHWTNSAGVQPIFWICTIRSTFCISSCKDEQCRALWRHRPSNTSGRPTFDITPYHEVTDRIILMQLWFSEIASYRNNRVALVNQQLFSVTVSMTAMKLFERESVRLVEFSKYISHWSVLSMFYNVPNLGLNWGMGGRIRHSEMDFDSMLMQPLTGTDQSRTTPSSRPMNWYSSSQGSNRHRFSNSQQSSNIHYIPNWSRGDRHPRIHSDYSKSWKS